MLERLFDAAVSTIALIILSPVFLVFALLIRTSSPGPIFYRQVRVGRFGHEFRIHKFRTMVAEAERLGPPVTTRLDPRITRIGHVLRKYKLDELPQLIDVARGTMSLVGPRPEVPRYVAMYPEAQRREILSVRPGITDPASLHFRNESDMLSEGSDPEQMYVSEILPRKLALSIDYVRHKSLTKDLAVIFHTVLALFRRGTGGGEGNHG